MNEQEIISKQLYLLNNRQMFDIEITTHCNKSCYICPRDNFQRKNREMAVDTFDKIIKWLPTECDVYFAGYGEPLLNKNCINFVNQLYKKGIRTSVYTNGKLLTHGIIKKLFAQGLFKLQISILLRDEITQIEKYAEMIDVSVTSGVRFNLLCDNSIEKPLHITNKLKIQGFEIEYKQIHNRAQGLHDDVFISPIITCGAFFAVNYIDTEGNLQVCCNDINGKYNLGSIFDMTFEDYIEKKKQYLGNKQIIPICKHCTDEYRLKHFEL